MEPVSIAYDDDHAGYPVLVFGLERKTTAATFQDNLNKKKKNEGGGGEKEKEEEEEVECSETAESSKNSWQQAKQARLYSDLLQA